MFDLCDVDVMGCSKVHGGSCRKSSRARQDLLRCMGHRWLERNIICVGATLGCLEAPRWTWGLQLLRQAEGESLEISHSVFLGLGSDLGKSICCGNKSTAKRVAFSKMGNVGMRRVEPCHRSSAHNCAIDMCMGERMQIEPNGN